MITLSDNSFFPPTLPKKHSKNLMNIDSIELSMKNEGPLLHLLLL